MRYACKICSRTYSKKRNLASHMHIHNPHWRRFQCDQCPMSYTAKGSLTFHIQTHHNGLRVAECENCDNKFKSRYRLKKHKCDVTQEPLECPNCNFVTNRKASYSAHVRTCVIKYYKCTFETMQESKFLKHCENKH